MTTAYITQGIRDDAATIIKMVHNKPQTRNEIAKHLKRGKNCLDRAFQFAKAQGKIDFVRVGTTCYWGSAKQVAEIRAEWDAQAKERERLRLKRRYEQHLDLDNVPDMPVVQRVVSAWGVKMPATNAPRWIFDAAA